MPTFLTLFEPIRPCFKRTRLRITTPPRHSLPNCCPTSHTAHGSSLNKSRRHKIEVTGCCDRPWPVAVGLAHPPPLTHFANEGMKMRFLLANQPHMQALRLPRTLCRSLLANMFLCTIQQPAWARDRSISMLHMATVLVVLVCCVGGGRTARHTRRRFNTWDMSGLLNNPARHEVAKLRLVLAICSVNCDS